MSFSQLVAKRLEIVNIAVSREDLLRNLEVLQAEDISTEALIARWASRLTGTETSESPVLKHLIRARAFSLDLGMGWGEPVAMAVAREALAEFPDEDLPLEVLDKNEEAIRRVMRENLQRMEQQLAAAERLYAYGKANYRSGIDESRQRRLVGWGGWSFFNKPPLLGPVRVTDEIGAQRGRREAPAGILLAIAHGLATNDHWWLTSPTDREAAGWALPTPLSLKDVEEEYNQLYVDGDQRAPRVQFRLPGELLVDLSETGGVAPDPSFRWEGGDLASNYARFVQIRVEEGAVSGTIQWCTGKWIEAGDEFTCSSFLASILTVLPEAVDTGAIEQMMAAYDRLSARAVTTIRQAKAAGVRVEIYNRETGEEIASGMTMRREGEENLHLGYEPRRSWTPDGQERRFARWLRPDEREQLVAEAEPFPWVVREDQEGGDMEVVEVIRR